MKSTSTTIFRPLLWFAVFAALPALLAVAPAARAELELSIAPTALTGSPGQRLTYSGTLTNLGTTAVFLNGDTFTLLGTGLNLDDSPFLDDFPLSLTPGASVLGGLFTVTIGLPVRLGTYTGSFTVLGGPNAQDLTALVTRPFAVNVPEPATFPLLLGGLTTLCAVGLRRKRRG